MAENDYREYKKEEEGNVSTNAVAGRVNRANVVVGRRLVVRHMRPVRSVSAATPEDYLALKETMTAVAEGITQEIRNQHETTRAALLVQHQQTRDAVQHARRDLLDAVKASPAQFLKLISEFGSLFLVFALAVWRMLHIELVNPAFAIFMLFAFALYWGMAHLGEKDEKKTDAKPSK
jgi:hypothetical protein